MAGSRFAERGGTEHARRKWQNAISPSADGPKT